MPRAARPATMMMTHGRDVLHDGGRQHVVDDAAQHKAAQQLRRLGHVQDLAAGVRGFCFFWGGGQGLGFETIPKTAVGMQGLGFRGPWHAQGLGVGVWGVAWCRVWGWAEGTNGLWHYMQW